MDVKKLKETIEKPILTDDEYDYGIEQCRNTIIEILSGDISGATEFLETCSEIEFVWTLECLPQLTEKTVSKEIYEAAEKRHKTLENQDYKDITAVDLKYTKRTLLHLLGEDEDEQEDTDENSSSSKEEKSA